MRQHSSAVMCSSATQGWRTPPEVLDAVRRMGPIGLDPATSEDNPVGARFHLHDRGLSSWPLELLNPGEIVWLNPPFGRGLPQWTRHAISHAYAGTDILILTPARVGTAWYRELKLVCSAYCEWSGRIKFLDAGGHRSAPAPFPVVIWYLGADRWRFKVALLPHGDVYVAGFGWAHSGGEARPTGVRCST